jgi:mannosyltransferase
MTPMLMTSFFTNYQTSVIIDRLALMVVFILAILLRFHALERPFFWLDEAFSLRLGAMPIDKIWYYTGRDVHPPFYYYVLHLWFLIWGESPYAARTLSAVAGSLTVACSVYVVRAIAGPRAGIVCGLLTAFLPIAVRYSQEARMYSLLSFLLVASLLALTAWVINPDRKRYLCWYVFFSVLAMYTHYLAALAILSNWVYLVFMSVRSTREYKYVMHPLWWVANAFVAVSYIPWAFSLLHLLQTANLVGPNGAFAWVPHVSYQTIPSLFWAFVTLQNVHAEEIMGCWLLTFLILVLSWFIVFRDKSPFSFGMLIVSYLWTPLIVALVVSTAVPVITTRYFAYCAMAVPMIIAIAIAYSRWRYVVVTVVLMMLIEVSGVLSVYQQRDDLNYSRAPQDFPMEKLAEKLKRSIVSGDKVVVEGALWYYSLEVYGFSGLQPMLFERSWVHDIASRPTGFGFLSLLDPVRDEVFLYSLSKLSNESKRIWWVSGNSDSNMDENMKFPNKWVQEGKWDFGNLNLRLFNVSASSNE